MATRRNVLIGLGSAVAGGGALFATGAFTTVEAERTVSVETAGDANALLSFTPARDDEAYVAQTDGTIEINLDGSDTNAEGLNQNARTRFENLVDVTNQGMDVVGELTFEFDVTNSGADADHEAALRITSGDATIDADGSTNLIEESSEADADEDELDAGETMPFGLEVDLLESSIDDIDEDAEITLTITANAAE